MQSLKWFVICFASFICFSSISFPEDPMPINSTIDPCGITNEVFEIGEKVTYRVFYNWNFVWINAGEVTFEVRDTADKYHLVGAGRTAKSYDWIFKVRDYYDSYIEKSTLMPELTVRKVLEGKYTQYDKTAFHHNHMKAVSEKGKTKETANIEEIALAECTHDILSSIYMMRNIDFSTLPTGSQVPLNIYLDREIYPLTIVFKGAGEKRVKGLGKCNTLFFEPELIVGNIFTKDKGMKIWASNDENRVPLLIESPISVGKIKAVLIDSEGLKYPEEYLVKK